ncbi:hypothetical protein TOPH_06392 [Tolypocladium ophioglossoides CBS 100239]|uniref:CFEM domain-containing protein n=1 Tax=Tolypocladium ophioglossoides (strain CBS 100239) TaxID=1163406 RepID=A0A0L0N4Z4_TOLOC|nr:hypothetical protein TOPH_06392 [Tolypocladium ophioglossoides CBS 100239]
MGRVVPLVFGALSALHVLGVIAQEIPTCIPQCANQLRAGFTKFACGSADDAGCLCAKPDFAYGIRDCGASCGATDANVHQFLVGAFCAGLMPAASTSAAAPSSTVHPATSSTAQSSTTQAAVTTSSTPSSTSDAPTATQQSSSTTPTTSSSATAESTSTTSASKTSATPSATSGIPASATSSTAAAGGDSSGTGLSQAAVIGIGVGIGGAVIAIAGIVIGLLLRNRKRKPRQSIEISKPLPGSGRTYPPRDRDHGSFEKYGNDIEMTSNRYEDMVPRTQPRTMV